MSKTLDVNATTGEEIIRDMTADEIKEYEKIIAKEKAKVDQEIATETARISALAKLAALGLTPEEINAIS
jgi:hypothetical protein